MDNNVFYVPCEPVAKPRMTRSDKWKKRKCVLAYRNFADAVRMAAKDFSSPGRIRISFYFAFKPSHTKKFRDANIGKPHQVRPDVDNCAKGILDALYDNDSHIYHLEASKFWTNRRDNKPYVVVESI